MVTRNRTRALVPRRLLRTVLYVLAIVLIPLLVGAANLGVKAASLSGTSGPPDFAGALPAPPVHDPGKQTAVVLASASGAEITDFLPPYEILARSGAFNVYAVAPERRPLPLLDSNRVASGLDIVPHYSFAEYDARFDRAPDLIVIPYFPGYTPERDVAVLDWIRGHRGPQTIILTICAGTETLADTGLLGAGDTITTNVFWYGKLEPRFPQVRFLRGVRYADDGRFITSTNLASGVDATLRAVDRLAGRVAAEDVARQLGYRGAGYLDDPSFRPPATMATVPAIVATAAYSRGWQELGLVLYDGVGELALAALVDPYTTTLSARVHTLAPRRGAVTSQHGLTFVPRYDFVTAPRLDRVVLPGGQVPDAARQAAAGWAQAQRGLPLEEVHATVGAGEFAYDATLRDLARTGNGGLALAAARVMFLPEEHLPFAGAAWPLGLLARPLALGLLGAGLLTGLRAARGRGRRAQPALASA
jgi:transcriptional regulator GlxA family with amidase domain